MKKLLFLLSIFAIVLSCSSDETSTPVTPPAPIVKYTITLSAGEGGTVSTTGGDYESGQTVSVTATPQGEYLFKDWSDGNTNATRTITISSNTTLTANFEKKKYPLTLNIEGEGEVLEEIVNSGRTTEYDSGTTVKLTAQAAAEWVFVGWTGDIESTEESVQIVIGDPKTVTAIFKKSILFSFATPNYSNINYSSGTVVQNQYAPPFLLTADFIYENIEIYEDCNLPRPGVNVTDPIYDNYTAQCQTKYLLFENNYKYLDYNGDNKPDLFGFISKTGSKTFDLPGKFFLIDDVFNDFSIKYFDSEIYFLGIPELNDFNNDGRTDILVFGSEDHENWTTGSQVSNRKSLTLIEISQAGDLSQRKIGPPTSSHDITSLDIDNDGDIDVVNFEYYMGEGATEHQEKPLVYLNNGNGNFDVRDDIFLLPDEFYDYSETMDFWVNAGDSFDLNNDGFLDLIIGWGNTNTESETQDCYKVNDRGFIEFCGTYQYPIKRGFQIVWGSKEGVFDYTKSTFLNLDLENFSSKGTLGFNFIDLNNDNKFDILVNGQADNYSYTYIDFYLNNGDKTFTRVTENYIEENSWLNTSVNGDYPMPYTFNIIDIDQDGSFDLSPSYFINGGNIFQSVQRGKKMIGPNFYYKNVGSKFILQKDLIDSKFKN